MERRKEIPSSLDLLPLGERFGDKNLLKVRMRPNTAFANVASKVNHGKKSVVAKAAAEPDYTVSRRKGENFGRMTPQGLNKFLSDAKPSLKPIHDPLVEIMRTGKFPPKLAPPATVDTKIILLDLRAPE